MSFFNFPKSVIITNSITAYLTVPQSVSQFRGGAFIAYRSESKFESGIRTADIQIVEHIIVVIVPIDISITLKISSYVSRLCQKFIVARNPRMISVLSLSFWLLTICASAVTCIHGVTSAL